MSEVFKAIKERRSIRKYTDQMPGAEQIDQVIDAGISAASGRGLQSPIVVAVTDKKVRDELAEDNRIIAGGPEGMDPFYGAQVVLIVLAKKDVRTGIYDGSLVIGNMMLEAYDLGLGSCWIHRAKEEFEMPKWKQFLKDLGVEGEYEGVGHCILGYPNEDKEAPEILPDRVYYVK